MNIQKSLLAFGGALAAAVVVASAVGGAAINHVRIGGNAYSQIAQGKDLVADILPPPAYVIESYLEAGLALNGEKPLGESVAILKKLHNEYDERREFWRKSNLEDAIKQKLTQTSHAAVSRFWEAVESGLLPALERNDRPAAMAAFARVKDFYAQHRAVVDDIVKDAERMNAEIESNVHRQGTLAFASAGLVILILFGVLAAGIVLMRKHVVLPVVGMTSVMKALAAGSLETQVPFSDRNDEIGDMAKTLLVFRDAGVAKLELERTGEAQRRESESLRRKEAVAQAEAAEERAATARDQALVVGALANGLRNLSERNLGFRLTETFPPSYEQLRGDFNTAMKTLSETIQAISQAAEEVNRATAEISAGTTDLSQRTEEQAATLEETSASMEQISATVKKNADNAQLASGSAAVTRERAATGGEVVAEAVQAMTMIDQSSRKISDIIGVIDEIARQTNLLALNAAVEAARAGDAGRGFAVVASEVRSLAQRSSQAAKDIKELITTSNGQVRDGVDLVNRAGQSLAEIVSSINGVADIVANIAAASAEQASGVEQVNKALSQMDEVTQQNSALVEQSAATAKTLEQQSAAMNERVRSFRVDRIDGAADQVSGTGASPAARPAVARSHKATMPKADRTDRGPAKLIHSRLASALKRDPEWQEF